VRASPRFRPRDRRGRQGTGHRPRRKAGKRVDEAINALAVVLKKYPVIRKLRLFQVATFAEQERLTEALATYDAFANARKRQDAALLAPIARADLAEAPLRSRVSPSSWPARWNGRRAMETPWL
jgi:hypothetical protein